MPQMLNLHAHSGYAQLTVVAAWCTASTCRVHPAAAGMAVEMAVLVCAISFLTACQASCLNPSAIHTNGYQTLSGSGFGCNATLAAAALQTTAGTTAVLQSVTKLRVSANCIGASSTANVAAEVGNTLWTTPTSI